MKTQETTFKEFVTEYVESLRKPSCLPACVEEVCGGCNLRSQETFKQIILKLTKKGTNPLPLWFEGPESMDTISNKVNALHQLFKLMDLRKKGRIDAYELFAVITIMVTGDLPTKFGKNVDIIDFFGTEKPNSISQNEMYYFLDSLFRGLYKILIRQGYKTPTGGDKRISDEELKRIIKIMFKDTEKVQFLMKDELIKNHRNLMDGTDEAREVFRFFDKVQKTLETSLIYAREQALINMKNSIEIKRVIFEMIAKLEKEDKDKNKIKK